MPSTLAGATEPQPELLRAVCVCAEAEAAVAQQRTAARCAVLGAGEAGAVGLGARMGWVAACLC